MEQNSRPIIVKVAEATGVCLDELNGAIEAFGAGIADPVAAVVEQAGLMAGSGWSMFLAYGSFPGAACRVRYRR